jgi:hypothetical protein
MIVDDMERVWSTARRGFSARSIFMFVLAVFITALLWASFGSSTDTHAVDGAPTTSTPANWNNDSLLFDGHRFFPAPQAKAGEGHGLAVGTNYYVYVQEPSTDRQVLPKAFVIYFAPGLDPPTATSASYISYDYGSRVFSNPEGKQTIQVTPRGEESSFAASSCSVEGIGWIICPVSVFLAGGMDIIFDMVKGFLEVQPTVLGDPNNDLYTAWNIIRSIANVAFIIVFLIIIYSQLTGLGVTNYGLKKLLPRMIIAAVLVNLSFFITALAIDISNILGYSLQDIFTQIRQDTFNVTSDTWSNSTTQWADITGFVLSGGAVVGGIAAYSIATAGAGGAIIVLLPILLGLILTVLFVLLVLAARQAIIIILIVIAPLAFVAYLLPNTEGWFKKWRDLFMTMLIFFPAFSLVFGGSQLAGGIIIQNATNVFTMIFGLAVQIAPLVITPLLLRLSGGLLGKIAGIVNDPRRGVMDRTKNWSKDRAEMHRLKSLGKPGGLNPFRRIAQRFDDNNQNVKNRTSQYQTANENRYHQTSRYSKIHTDAHQAELAKQRIENQNKSHTQRILNNSGSDLHLENVRLEESNIELGKQTKITEGDIFEYRAGRRVATGELNTLMTNMKENLTITAAEMQRAQSAQFIEQKNISEAFAAKTIAGRALLARAGGIDPSGAIRAEANALGALAKLEKEALDSSVQLLNARAIESNMTLKAYALQVVEQEINTKGAHQSQVLEAALEASAQDGQVSILRKARMSHNIDQTVLTKLFARNSGTMKEKGAFDLQADPSLAHATTSEMNVSIATTVGEVSANHLSGVKAGFWGDVANDMSTIISDSNAMPDPRKRAAATAGLRKTYITLTEALRNDDIRATLGDRLDETMRIHEALQNEYGDVDKTIDYNKYR